VWLGDWPGGARPGSSIHPVRQAVNDRGLFTAVWCERKILFWLEIYDRLRPSEQALEINDLGSHPGQAPFARFTTKHAVKPPPEIQVQKRHTSCCLEAGYPLTTLKIIYMDHAILWRHGNSSFSFCWFKT